MRYKQEFDKYIKERGYPIRTLVAFSGVVNDDLLPDVIYTEEGMNGGIRERELPARFATLDYQILLVAEKYQTGYDQPLLHTMYVDKRLSGIQAVQTLSRLNRVHPLKEDTFVLDFVNERTEIHEAFKQFYEGAEMGQQVEASRLYELQLWLDASGIYTLAEVERFAAVYFKPVRHQSAADHTAINAALDPAVDRFRALLRANEDGAELWRGKLTAFENLYAFLSQVIPYGDSDLERLATFLRHLAAKLPRRAAGEAYHFDDEVRLEYYRLQKIEEGSIDLTQGRAQPLHGPTAVGSGAVNDEAVPLSQLIDVVNERFGTDFDQADQLFFDQVEEAAAGMDTLQKAAQANPLDKFTLVFRQVLESLFIERMDLNHGLFARFMNDPELGDVITRGLAERVYDRLAGQTHPAESSNGRAG